MVPTEAARSEGCIPFESITQINILPSLFLMLGGKELLSLILGSFSSLLPSCFQGSNMKQHSPLQKGGKNPKQTPNITLAGY